MEIPELKSTNKEVIAFINAAANYQNEYPKERSKLTFSLIKQVKRYHPKIEKITEDLGIEINALRHRAASTDSDGNIIEKPVDFKIGEKGKESTSMRYVYKPEKLVTLDKEIEALKKKVEMAEFEIQPPYKEEPFYVPIPDKFDFKYLEAFKKFIFNPELSEKQEEEIYLNQSEKEQKPKIHSVLN